MNLLRGKPPNANHEEKRNAIRMDEYGKESEDDGMWMIWNNLEMERRMGPTWTKIKMFSYLGVRIV